MVVSSVDYGDEIMEVDWVPPCATPYFTTYWSFWSLLSPTRSWFVSSCRQPVSQCGPKSRFYSLGRNSDKCVVPDLESGLWMFVVDCNCLVQIIYRSFVVGKCAPDFKNNLYVLILYQVERVSQIFPEYHCFVSWNLTWISGPDQSTCPYLGSMSPKWWPDC